MSTYWAATLSNGEEVSETTPVPGTRSPWQKLLFRLRKERLKITNLTLHVNDKVIPTKENAGGYYQANLVTATFFGRSVSPVLRGVGYVEEGKVYVTYSNESGDTLNEILDLGSVLVHTTLAPI